MGFFNYGYTIALLGDFGGGIENLTKAIELDPDSTYYIRNLGELKYYSYDYEGSAKDLGTYISKEPNEPWGYVSRAMANL